MKFYDWGKTHSYTTTRVFFIIGGRSIGKTYGLRKECVKEYLKRGTRFVEVVRTKNELDGVQQNYFGKLVQQDEFPGYSFKTEGAAAYIAETPDSDEDSPKWELMGYFVALTNEQREKKRTFVNVRDIIFDEAIIDRGVSPYSRYLPDEWGTLLGIANTVYREIPGITPKDKRIHLLGNACDMQCPLFASLGITRVPERGERTFYPDANGNKRAIMVHRVEQNAAEYKTDTVVGGLAVGEQAAMFYENEFAEEGSDFIRRIPKSAAHVYNIQYGRTMGVYIDYSTGIVYVGRPLDKNTTYVLAKSDMKINYIFLNTGSNVVKFLRNMYSMGGIRYESAGYMGSFYALLDAIGVR